MNIIILRVIANIIGMDPKTIKVWSVLFTIWKYGKFDNMKMPTLKKLEKLVGLTDKPITRAINTLKGIRVKDRYQQSFPLLRVEAKRIKGCVENVYTLAVPEFGELTDPSQFTQEGGGSATMSYLGGYFTLTDEMQKLGLTINQEIVLATYASILEWEAYNYPVYNSATPKNTGYLECMKPEAIARAIRELNKLGYLTHSEAVKDKSYGWKEMKVNLNPNQDDIKEDDMTKEAEMEILEMAKAAIAAGNQELGLKLISQISNQSKEGAKPETKPKKKTESKPKAKKSDVEEMDFQNDYVKVYLSIPKNAANNSTITGLIKGLKEGVAYWRTAGDVEASGYIESFMDHKVSMSYEILQEAPKEEYERESTEDAIAASKAENDTFFKSEPEEVEKVMSLLGHGEEKRTQYQLPKSTTREEAEKKLNELRLETKIYFRDYYKGEFTPNSIKWIDKEYDHQERWRKLNAQSVKKEEAPKKQEETPKEKTKEQLEFIAQIEREKELRRKQVLEEQVYELSKELDEIMELI